MAVFNGTGTTPAVANGPDLLSGGDLSQFGPMAQTFTLVGGGPGPC